ncbi:hypothetical protein SHAM105786_03555 [Shewanella amazonensis]
MMRGIITSQKDLLQFPGCKNGGYKARIKRADQRQIITLRAMLQKRRPAELLAFSIDTSRTIHLQAFACSVTEHASNSYVATLYELPEHQKTKIRLQGFDLAPTPNGQRQCPLHRKAGWPAYHD